MKAYIPILFFLITSCNPINKDEALFQELAERAIQGDMHSLLRIKQEFPERWEQMQKDGNKEKELKAKQEKENKAKVSSIKDLFGYDLSLDLGSFKEQYEDKISNCKETNSYRGQESLPYFICFTKDGDQFEFAGNDKLTIRSFHKNLTEEVLAKVFHQKLAEKTGLKLENSHYDMESIPYYKGKLTLEYKDKRVGNEYVELVRGAWYIHDESMDILQKEWAQKKINQMSNSSKEIGI